MNKINYRYFWGFLDVNTFIELSNNLISSGTTNTTTSSLSLSGSGSYSRQVTREEGSALAKKFGCPFIETSAAHRKHVDDVFHTLVREIKRHQVCISFRYYTSFNNNMILIQHYFIDDWIILYRQKAIKHPSKT